MTSGLRVLVTADAVGGVWTYSLDLARGLAGLGIETVVACMGPSPSSEQAAAAKRVAAKMVDTGLPLDWIADDPAALAEAARCLAQLAEQTGADLVQLNS
ncbi:MAG: glycosyltransferase family 4 protein, partial [Pseudomonadota bacterium]|nr:glycosyltransferase family 4 protein [Pseudomonadota bacterium]